MYHSRFQRRDWNTRLRRGRSHYSRIQSKGSLRFGILRQPQDRSTYIASCLRGQCRRFRNVTKWVACVYRRRDWYSRSKKVISRKLLECTNGSVKKVNNLGVFLVVLAITCNVKSRGACSVLWKLKEGEKGIPLVWNEHTYFMCPKSFIGCTLVNPILVHWTQLIIWRWNQRL